VLLSTALASWMMIPGCGDQDRPLARIDQMSKDYCSFLTGSYWIYQKAASAVFDTVSIYHVRNTVQSIPEYLSYDFEEIKMDIFWSSNGYDSGNGHAYIQISGELDLGKDISVIQEQTPWFRGPNVIFAPLRVKGKSLVIYANDTIQLIEKQNSLVIGDSTYRDILVIQTTTNFHSTKHEYSYWAKNIGRIRFVNFNGELWDLVAHTAIPSL